MIFKRKKDTSSEIIEKLEELEEKKVKALINIDKRDIETYDMLREEEIFSDKQLKDIFLFAAALGFKTNNRFQIIKKHPYIRISYLTKRDWAILYTIAYSSSEDTAILLDKNRVLEINEEYAKGGISILYSLLHETQLTELTKEIEIRFLKDNI